MKKKLVVSLVLLLTALLALSSCANMPQASDPLDGTTWVLVAYRKTSPLEGTTITAEFAEGEVRGSGGCNSYFGSYTIEGQQLTIDGLGWTEMACLNPDGVMEQEQEIMRYISTSEAFEIEDGRLSIQVGGHETLTFDPLE